MYVSLAIARCYSGSKLTPKPPTVKARVLGFGMIWSCVGPFQAIAFTTILGLQPPSSPPFSTPRLATKPPLVAATSTNSPTRTPLQIMGIADWVADVPCGLPCAPCRHGLHGLPPSPLRLHGGRRVGPHSAGEAKTDAARGEWTKRETGGRKEWLALAGAT